MGMNYKEWIAERMDKIAAEQHKSELKNLPAETKAEIFSQACEDWGNHRNG